MSTQEDLFASGSPAAGGGAADPAVSVVHCCSHDSTRNVAAAVKSVTGDPGFAAWAAAEYPRGGFSLYGAREGYRRHCQVTALLAGALELTSADIKTLLSLAVTKAGDLATSGEPVHRGAAPRFFQIAAQLRQLTDATPAGTVFRLTPAPALAETDR